MPKGTPRRVWLTVQDDDHSAESHWGCLTDARQVLRKTIRLNVPRRYIAKARIRYLIEVNPYVRERQAHLSTAPEDMRLADLLVRINGADVARRHVFTHAVVGWHALEIPVEHLRNGDNHIDLSLAPPKDGAGKVHYPYVYVGIDTDATRTARSMSSNDHGTTFGPSLRPGHPKSARAAWRGEYMIRLEIAVPLE